MKNSKNSILMNTRAHVFLSGRVQGVFFRTETENEALRHGVNGWIRNLPDGRVEAVFEGSEDGVKRLVEFCKRGPVGARVTDAKVYWEPYKGEFKDFKVRNGHYF
jgi:acylphosphatase